jgi:hypothetical protein
MIYLIIRTQENHYFIEADSKEEAEKKFYKTVAHCALNDEEMTPVYGETRYTDANAEPSIDPDQYDLFDNGLNIKE